MASSDDTPTITLDELMDRDPLEMSASDIDAIVAYHRRMRLKVHAGEAVTTTPKIDIASVLDLATPKADGFKRRV